MNHSEWWIFWSYYRIWENLRTPLWNLIKGSNSWNTSNITVAIRQAMYLDCWSIWMTWLKFIITSLDNLWRIQNAKFLSRSLVKFRKCPWRILPEICHGFHEMFKEFLVESWRNLIMIWLLSKLTRMRITTWISN